MSERSITRFSGLLAMLVFCALPSAADPPQDPTRPPSFGMSREASDASGSDDTEELSLQAVFQAESRRVAIVNDRRVGVGDIVRSARVVSIEGDRVTLRRRGQTIELELIPMAVKRRPESGRGERGEVPPVAAPDLDPEDAVHAPPAHREGFES